MSPRRAPQLVDAFFPDSLSIPQQEEIDASSPDSLSIPQQEEIAAQQPSRGGGGGSIGRAGRRQEQLQYQYRGRGPGGGRARGRGGLQQQLPQHVEQGTGRRQDIQQGYTGGWRGIGHQQGGRARREESASSQDWRVGGGSQRYRGHMGGDHGRSRRGRIEDQGASSSGSGGGRGRGYHEQEEGASTSSSVWRGRRRGSRPFSAFPELHSSIHGLSLEDPQSESSPLPLPADVTALSSESNVQRSIVAASSIEPMIAPNRPAPGTEGRVIHIRANHFFVRFKPDNIIYHYDVKISPNLTSKVIARALKRALLSEYSSDFDGKLPIYDGSKSMYTAGPLPFQQREFCVSLPDLGSEEPSSRRKKNFNLSIRHVSTLNRTNLENFLVGQQVSTPQEHLQALDVLLREHPSENFISVGRSFYKKELGSAQLEGGLIALNGFYQSLRPTMQGLALNIDMSTTAFHDSIDVLDFLKQQFKHFNPHDRIPDAVRLKVKKALVRLKVQVLHRQTPRRYRISGLSTLPTRDLKFPLEGGGEMRVMDYFKLTYEYEIQYPELPSLQVQANKLSYLPMEVCRICDGQKFAGKLSERQTTNLRELACVKPVVREGKVMSIMEGVDGPGSGKFVTNFGVTVTKELTDVRARLLPTPRLKYGEQGQVQEIMPHMGAWNLLNSCVVEGGNVDYWALIAFDKFLTLNVVKNFISSLSSRCIELGVHMVQETVVPPVFYGREDLENPRLEQSLRSIYEHASQAIHSRNQGQAGRLKLLVCVMADRHPAYGDLKRICETQIGIVTQCCLSRHVKQCKSQYLANLVLKINAKAGGRNVSLALELPQMCPVFSQPTIIFGADVTHPHPGDDSGPSIAAVVANTDWPSANKYIARVQSQTHREEIIENLRGMVQDLWREFCDKTGTKPDRVIMFRDGVSEGQFDQVLQKEVLALKEALKEVGGPYYKPLITWVIVQKRHHTRLFPRHHCGDRNNNILPGTVVDTKITHPREFDFYLCSHAGIQGTSRPTHYHVLWDENGFNSDDLQGMVYNFCYTYARCTRAVSVVPPAYYAHLAAYRARLYLESLGGSDTTSIRGHFGMLGSGESSRAAAPAIRPLPRILRSVQEVMYYC